MKVSDLRKMTDEELSEELEKMYREGFNLRMQIASDQLQQTHLLAQNRRDIARVKTILRKRSSE